jgi:dolichyl-phosphate-mannose--protein O-mannosyl transferase
LGKWIRTDWLVALLSFVIIPPLIYYSAFQLSHFRSGEPAKFADFWARQVGMFKYHSELVATHPFSSRWFEWPIIKRPLWLYSGKTFITESGRETMRSIVSLGNPLIWWSAIPLFFYAIASLIKKFELVLFIVLVTIFGLYLPWVVSPRQLTFIYHFFPIVPFAILLLAWFACKAQSGWKSTRVFAFASASGLLFLLFFPVLSGLAVPKDFILNYLRWFESWIF